MENNLFHCIPASQYDEDIIVDGIATVCNSEQEVTTGLTPSSRTLKNAAHKKPTGMATQAAGEVQDAQSSSFGHSVHLQSLDS